MLIAKLFIAATLICVITNAACCQELPEEKEAFMQSVLDSAERYKLKDPDRSLAFALQALELIPAKGYEKMRALAHLKAANAEKMNTRRLESLRHVDEAIRVSFFSRDSMLLMRSHFMKASIHGFFDQPDSALVYFQRTIDFFKPGMDIFYVANAYTNIGSIWRTMGQSDRAEEYYRKGYAISRGDQYTWIFTLSRLIDFYADQQSPEYYAYIDTFMQSDFVRNGKKEMVAAHFYTLLGVSHATIAEKEAKLKSIYEMAIKESGPIHQVELGIKLNDILVDQKKYTASKQLLDNLLTIAKTSQNGRVEAEVNNALYKNARAMSSPNALAYLERFSFLKDSLHAEELQKQIQELNVRFEVAQKDLAISQQEVQLEQARRKRVYMTWLVSLIGLLGVVTFYYFRYRARSAERIQAQQTVIHQQDTERMAREKELAMLNAALESQEGERNRIARELHDGIGSMMSGISAHVEVLSNNGDTYPHLDELRELIKETTGEVRRTAHELMPVGLMRHGLESAIRELCLNMLVRNGITPTVEIQESMSVIPREQQLLVYRILQELFQNIIRHAGADQVLLQMTEFDEEVSIIVEDNGRGFSNNGDQRIGIGMTSIQSRVALLGGIVDIASSQGDGTTATINFKVSKENNAAS